MEKIPEGQSVHSVIKAYIEQLEEKDKALSDANKEIEFLNKNCDNLNEVINDCGNEIGRLKGLIESLHTDAFGISTFKWLEYKKQHNL